MKYVIKDIVLHKKLDFSLNKNMKNTDDTSPVSVTSAPEAMCNECGNDITDPTWWEVVGSPFFDFCDSCIEKMRRHPAATFERLDPGIVKLSFSHCMACYDEKGYEEYDETLPEKKKKQKLA